MKIIFLDIDGVITSARTGWMNWDIYAVTFLKWVCQKADAKIVISSTWRFNHSKEFFDAIFPGLIHEDWRTGANHDAIRGVEIQQWLDSHPEISIMPVGYPESKSYLILDDDSDMFPSQMANFIQTDTYNGLLLEHMEQIRDHFGLTNEPCNMNRQTLVMHPNMFNHNNEQPD